MAHIRKKHRLAAEAYISSGIFFITICTNTDKSLFWESYKIDNNNVDVIYSNYGLIALKYINNIPLIYNDINILNFVIMPNHIHLLFSIDCNDFGMRYGKESVSTVIQQLKMKVSREIGHSIWQKGFYDHIIRNDRDYSNTWDYIENNPIVWASNS